jgi:hypothetical protein
MVIGELEIGLCVHYVGIQSSGVTSTVVVCCNVNIYYMCISMFLKRCGRLVTSFKQNLSM